MVGVGRIGLAAAASVLAAAGTAQGDVLTLNFAAFGNSYSAFIAGDDPAVGRQVVLTRIYLTLQVSPGSDAAAFTTDLLIPLEPDAGNTNVLFLSGAALGWSGSGTFEHIVESTAHNGIVRSGRYGGETPPDPAITSAQIVAGSRIELVYVPAPAGAAAIILGLAWPRRRRVTRAVHGR